MAEVTARKVLLKDIDNQYIVPWTGAAESVNGEKPDANGHVEIETLSHSGVKVIDSPNYNTITAPGFYHCNSTGATNGPGYATKMIVLGDAKGSGHLTQIAYPIYSTTTTMRPKFRSTMDGGATWEEWKTLMATTDKAASATTADSATKAVIADIAKNADRLSIPRKISLVGQVTGSGGFDGSSDVNISVSLADTGVTAGTYGESSSATLAYGAEFAVPLVAVDPKGRITSAAATKLRMPATPVTSINGSTGDVKLFTAGTGDLTAGSSSLATGKLYFVYE